MPYYIGDVIRQSEELVARTPEKFGESGITISLNTTVESVDHDKGLLKTAAGETIGYDHLVIATGTNAIRPDIPGIDRDGVFVLKNLTDGIAVKKWVEDNHCRRAVVVGAGFVAMELAEAFRTRDMDTTVVYRGTRPIKRWDKALTDIVTEELEKNRVTFVTGTSPRAVEESGGGLRLVTDNGDFDADVIVFGLGVKPETSIARDIGLEMGTSGAIKVNFSQRTSREEIFAVGDCAEAFHRIRREWVHIPLGDTANKQGRIVGCIIGGAPRVFQGVVGAQSFKFFGLEIAATGIDEAEAVACGYHPESHVTKGTFRTPSMQGRAKMSIKLTADRATGRLLGAQAVSNIGAVGRINILSACLWSEMTLDQIGYLDFAYSPPFGGAWDIVHRAAQGLQRKL